MGGRLSWIGLAATLASCSASGAQLHVDVRTDLTPGIEFVVTRVEVFRDADAGTAVDTIDHAALGNESYVRGQRVADVPLANGDYRVHVELIGARSALEVDRTIAVHLSGDLSITVVLTRSCVGIVCAGSQVCVAGQCADPDCLSGGCAPQCASVASCTNGAPCATASCVEGACFYAGTPGACATNEWCDPRAGCVALTTPLDAGAADAATPNDAASCSCAGRACGDDGCGHSCGTCGGGTSCNASFQCTSDPPDCSGLACGPAHNGIGGADACGACGSATMCSAGACIPTPPDCSALTCGPAHNGIGGPDACGSCGAGFTCAGGACQCGGGGAACAAGSCCAGLSCTSGNCCVPVQSPCGSGCCPGRQCDASRGVCCVVIGDGCSSDGQCCGYPNHQCGSGVCCAVVGQGCARPAQCCTGNCTSGTCR